MTQIFFKLFTLKILNLKMNGAGLVRRFTISELTILENVLDKELMEKLKDEFNRSKEAAAG